MWEFFLSLLLSLPLAIAIIFIFGVLAFLYPEQAKSWGSIVAYWMSRFFKGCEYYAIKWDIEGNINSFAEEISNSNNNQFPKIYIKWIAQAGSEEVLWEENKVIVYMRDRGHKGRNFVSAAHIFTSNTLLGNSNYHISKKQKTSMDLYATKKLLERRHAAFVQQYMNDYFAPIVNSDNSIRELISKYVQIERIRAFFPILIFEIYTLGTKVHVGEVSKSEIIEEVKQLIDFLVEFSNRESGSYGELSFVGDYTRCAIKIVASAQTRQKGDTSGHVRSITDLIDRSIENIYLIGSNKEDNRSFIGRVLRDLKNERPGILLVKVYSYTSVIKLLGNRNIKADTCLVHIQNPEAVDYIVYRSEDTI